MKVIIVADQTSFNIHPRNEKTLLENCYQMFLEEFSNDDIIIQTIIDHKSDMEAVLPSDANIFYEPTKKGTAPAIGIAATRILKENPDELILVAYSDHPIKSSDKLFPIIKGASKMFNSLKKLILIGVNPSYPATKYGYAKIGIVEEQVGDLIAFEMTGFTEKPGEEVATEFLKSWRYLWNTGYLITSAGELLNMYKELLPKLHQGLMTYKESIGSDYEESILNSVYESFEKVSIDKGIYEKIDKSNVVVLPVDLEIEDLQI